jgi:hypothetical protein
MDLVWLAALILGAGFAITGGQRVKWKLLNLAIILSCMGLGFGLGYAAGLGSKNMGSVSNVGSPLSLMLGIVGALGCIQLNNWRVK